MLMNQELPKRSASSGREVYAKWLGIMAAFALLPAVARAVGATPWIAELAAPYARYALLCIAEPVAAYANYMTLSYGDPYVLFDAFGTFGAMMAGAYFGAHYGVYRIAWKRWRWAVLALVLAISATISTTAIVQGVVSSWPYGEAAVLAVDATRDVVVGVAGVVLGANIGRLRGTDKLPKRVIYVMEYVLLSVIFALVSAAAYAQIAPAESSDGVNAVLDHTAPLTGSAVVGALLGVHYDSHKPRHGGRPRFGGVVVVLLAAAIVVNIIVDRTMPQHPDVTWIILALSSVGMAIIGNVLGMCISARQHMRTGGG